MYVEATGVFVTTNFEFEIESEINVNGFVDV